MRQGLDGTIQQVALFLGSMSAPVAGGTVWRVVKKIIMNSKCVITMEVGTVLSEEQNASVRNALQATYQHRGATQALHPVHIHNSQSPAVGDQRVLPMHDLSNSNLA